MDKDVALQVLADYIVENGINYVGGVFEKEGTDEEFTVVVAKESAHRKLTSEIEDLRTKCQQLEQSKVELFNTLEDIHSEAVSYQNRSGKPITWYLKVGKLLEKHK